MGTWIVFFGGILIGMCLLCIIGGVRLEILKERGIDMDFYKFFAWIFALVICAVTLTGCVGGIWFLIEQIVR